MNAVSRRRLLQTAAALGLVAPTAAGCSTVMEDSTFFESRGTPIGIQLYTLSDLIRSDLEGTLQAVAQIGFRTVETPNYMGKTPQQIRVALDAANLVCTSAHITPGPGTATEPGLAGDLDLLAEHMHIIGASHVIAPIFSPPSDVAVPSEEGENGARRLARVAAAMSADHWKRLSADLNRIGAKLKSHGLGFGYHNHSIEFVPLGVGTAWDLMIAETDPALVTFELDAGWAAAAGLDPAAVFRKNPDRYGLIHMKDIQPSTQANLLLRMDPADVGSGRLNWAEILPAAYQAGVRKFFYEQEPPFPGPRLDSAARSFRFLSTLKA